MPQKFTTGFKLAIPCCVLWTAAQVQILAGMNHLLGKIALGNATIEECVMAQDGLTGLIVHSGYRSADIQDFHVEDSKNESVEV